MIKEIKLPEIADNVNSATVTSILVSVNDKVTEGHPLIEMESDKATFEVPSLYNGIVKEIKVKDGETVNVGSVLMLVDQMDLPGKENPPATPDKTIEVKKDKPEKIAEELKVETSPDIIQKETIGISNRDLHASPSVRKFARELGVGLSLINGTGPANRITQEDVKAFVKRSMTNPPQHGTARTQPDFKLPDFSAWGNIEKVKMDNIRRLTAENMALSWNMIPHVNHFDKADITDLEKMRLKYSKQLEKKGSKLTLTAILVKIITLGLKEFPKFNASIDIQNQEIIYKKYFNIGIAVDTERGLLVPVIKNADHKNISEISVELTEMAQKARNKKLMPDDFLGGNFIISNLGGIGGINFTPIIFPTMVAILGVSRSAIEPVFIDGEFMPKNMLPLSLSYDHRLIDGAEAARFVRWICDSMENPLTLLK